MGKTAIIYASMSGNTEAIADLIEKGLTSAGAEAEKFETMDIDGSIFTKYDHFLIGAYTWGDGELPDEMLDFYDEMDEYDLSDKTIALFGSGDTAYEVFCGAVDLLAEKIKDNNGVLVMDSRLNVFQMESKKMSVWNLDVSLQGLCKLLFSDFFL